LQGGDRPGQGHLLSAVQFLSSLTSKTFLDVRTTLAERRAKVDVSRSWAAVTEQGELTLYLHAEVEGYKMQQIFEINKRTRRSLLVLDRRFKNKTKLGASGSRL
jgi:hypothetical protein